MNAIIRKVTGMVCALAVVSASVSALADGEELITDGGIVSFEETEETVQDITDTISPTVSNDEAEFTEDEALLSGEDSNEAEIYYYQDFNDIDQGTVWYIRNERPSDAQYPGLERFKWGMGTRGDANLSTNISVSNSGIDASGCLVLNSGIFGNHGRTPRFTLNAPENISEYVLSMKVKLNSAYSGQAAGLYYSRSLEDSDANLLFESSDNEWHDLSVNISSTENVFCIDNEIILIDSNPGIPVLYSDTSAANASALFDNICLRGYTPDDVACIYGDLGKMAEELLTDINAVMVDYNGIKVYSDITLPSYTLGQPLSWSVYEPDGSASARAAVDRNNRLHFESQSSEPMKLRVQLGDKFGEIEIIPSVIKENTVESTEIDVRKYGAAMFAYTEPERGYIVRLFTQDGEAREFSLAPSVLYWAANAEQSELLSGTDKLKIIKNVLQHQFPTDSASHLVNLCRYKLDDTGKITELFMAADKTVISSDQDALRVNMNNLNGYASRSKAIAGMVLKDGIVGISIPSDHTLFNDESKYAAFSVNSNDYLDSVNGTEKSFILGDFAEGGVTAQVLVEFKEYRDYNITDYGTAEDNPCMLVSGVSSNADGTYTINGVRGKDEVSYITAPNAVLYKSYFEYSNRIYRADLLWDYNYNEPLTSFISKGDTLGIKSIDGAACVLLKMVDINELAGEALTGNTISHSAMYSSSRDILYLSGLTNVNRMVDSTLITLPETYIFDDNTFPANIVTITTDSNGMTGCNVEKGYFCLSEAQEYTNKTGDVMFLRLFTGWMREAIIYRFNSEAPELSALEPLDTDPTPYRITDVSLTDASGNVYDTIPESGSFIAAVKLWEKKAYTGNIYLITAAYAEDGSLITLNYSYCAPLTDQVLTMGMNIQPNEQKVASVKAFVWDSLGGAQPLSGVYEITR